MGERNMIRSGYELEELSMVLPITQQGRAIALAITVISVEGYFNQRGYHRSNVFTGGVK